MLSSGANVIIWDEMISSVPNVIMLQSGANHLVLSCDVIIWDDNTPLFIFTENFTHSYSGDLVFSVHHEIHKYRRVLSKRARTYPPSVYQILALKSLCFLPRPQVIGINPLSHGGRPFWPYTSLNANYSKSS
jgi:hypothetical protein